MNLELNLNEQKNDALDNYWYDDAFKKKLDEALNEDILSFDSLDEYKYTSENLDVIYNTYKELNEKIKYDYANKNTMPNCEEGKLYSLQSVDKNNGIVKLNEYDGITMSQQKICVNINEIPTNINSNMFLRKKGDKYVADVVTTVALYEKMKNFFDDLNSTQKEYLESMRRDGNIYKIDYLEDDCETWYTTLINIETNEKFQEIDFPHDIFHDVGDYVKYEDGHYSVVPNTERYNERPYMYEFCEREQCYYTRFGKIDCTTMEMNNEKLEKLFIKAKQTNNGEKNFFTDMRIKVQIFCNKVLGKLTNK